MLRIGALAQDAYLTAFAVRADGKRIWYLPAVKGSPLMVAATSRAVVLSKGVRLGPEHFPGRYRVHVLLTDKPLLPGDVDSQGRLRARDRRVRAHAIREFEMKR